MQISQEELLAEAGQMALQVRLLERRVRQLQMDNDQLRAKLTAAKLPAAHGDLAPVEDQSAA